MIKTVSIRNFDDFATTSDKGGMSERSNARIEAAAGVSPRGGGKTSAKTLHELRILLVEDSPDNQALFTRMLEIAGAYVDVADNGIEGVERESRQCYDAIVMDIRMPVMDGYEATARIRAGGFRGPVIALTAHAVPGEEARCRSAGCTHFLTKPVDRAELVETLRSACRHENGAPSAEANS